MTASILFKLLLTTVSFSAAVPIEIQFEGMRSNAGALAISIFSETDRSGFPGDGSKAIKTYYRTLTDERSYIIAEDLPEGVYAVSVLHDEDGDKKLRSNFLGIPLEGFGFSKNPAIIFGPPGFNRAKFDTRDTRKVEIKMKYF